MKKKQYFYFNQSNDHLPDPEKYIPILGEIIEHEGELIGEIAGFCDEYGEVVNPEDYELDPYIYH